MSKIFLQEDFYSKFNERIRGFQNLLELYTSSDIEKVKNTSKCIKEFVIIYLFSVITVLSVLLLGVVLGTLPLGTQVIIISSVSTSLLFLSLSIGAGLIFIFLHKKKDYFLDKPNSPFQKRILINKDILVNGNLHFSILDISTLSKSGNGFIVSYYNKKESEISFRLISLLAIFYLPFVCIGSIVYTAIKIVLIFFYLLKNLLKKLIINNKFEFKDYVYEIAISFWRIVKSPFYATAMFYSLVYSLIFIRRGRIVTGIVERNWNENVILPSGYQLYFKHNYWKWEGGFSSKKLGQNGYYIAGCMQPTGIFLIRNWRIISGAKVSSFISLKRKSIFII